MTWEGNVRELENTIERALAVGDGVCIRSEDVMPTELPGDGAAPEDAIHALVERRVPLRAIEERMIEETLKATGGNKVEAARVLGISRRTLYRRGVGANEDGEEEH
jgi:DNA-binding NtrC family response regulator